MSEDRVTLYNEEMERQVLSVLMTYQDIIGSWHDSLSEDLFYFPKHRVVFRAVMDIYGKGEIPDMLNVSMMISSSHVEDAPEVYEIAEIGSSSVTSVTFGQNVGMLSDLAKRRRYWLLGQKLMAAGKDLTIDIEDVDKDIDKVREQRLRKSGRVHDMKAVNAALTERVTNNYNGDTSTMLPTGFSYVDGLGGFQLTDFNVIGGATSMGKTTFAINMAVNTARQNIPTMFISLEMTLEQMAARINAPLCGVPTNIMLYKKLRSDQIRDLETAKAQTDNLPLYIADDITTYEDVREEIRSNAIVNGVKIFFIDYLQVLGSSRKGRENEAQFYENISRELKNLAKELKVCIVPLVQLNRGIKDEDPRPTLSKIKASSGIEQAADTVLLLYRPGYYGKKHKYRPDLDPDAVSEVILGKGRNIGTGSFYVGFKKDLSQFYDLDGGSDSENRQGASQPQAEQAALPF